MELSDDRIQPALHALLANEADVLREALANDADLVRGVWNGNTLLEWTTQPPHGVDPACIAVLIEADAALDRALGLAGCFNLAALAQQLLDAGADPTSFESEVSPITPLESAAMHGSTDSADVLVAHGLQRPSLWLAAATGQLDQLQSWVSPTGELLKDPGPYRPNWAHVGRPEAGPRSDGAAEILGEALTFAVANDRPETLDYLLAAGVPIDAAPYRGITGLHFAVQFGKQAMVRHLMAQGASLAALDAEWNATPERWAEVCADGSANRDAIRELLSSAAS